VPKAVDVTDEELAKVNGPGEKVRLVIKAQPAKQITPTLQTTLDAWNRKSDKSIGLTSNALAYGFRFMKPREHSNMIRLLKGKHLRMCRIDKPPPQGSNAHSSSPYGLGYFVIRESCPDEVPDGTIAGRRRKR
jgi:hypothetical protein